MKRASFHQSIPLLTCVLLVLSISNSNADTCFPSPSGVTFGDDWGAAPSSSSYSSLTCLQITNDRPVFRQEVAYSGIPLKQSDDLKGESDLNRLVLVGANNRRIPCQFEVLSRWGGPVTDTSRAIRWVQIAIPLTISGDTVATFDLRLYSSSQQATGNSNVLNVVSNGNVHTVTTGVAEFTIDQTLGSLIRQIKLGSDTVLTDSRNQAGVTITFVPQRTNQFGSSPRTLTSENNGSVTYFEITESGPVKAVVMSEGVLSDPQGASLCDTFGSYYASPYESFTYSLALTFFRGRSDFKVQFHIRNQCSNGDGSDWTDQSFLVDQASYSLDFSNGIGENIFSSHYYGGSSTTSVSNGFPSGASVETIVEQRKGSGNPWRRRARVQNNGSSIQNAEIFEAPFIAVSNGSYFAGATLGNMRYREPQALRAAGSVVSIDVVSEQQRIGEGKGIWNFAMFVVQDVSGDSDQNLIQSARWPAVLEVGKSQLLYDLIDC